MGNEKKLVQIVAIAPSFRDQRIRVGPYFDDSRKAFILGNKTIPAKFVEDKKRGDRYVSIDHDILLDSTEDYLFQHEDTFDVSDRVQAVQLQALKDSGMLAPNRESINQGAGHRFYLMDEEEEAKKTSTKADKAFEVMGRLREMTPVQKRDLAFLLKQPASRMSEERIEAYLKDLSLQDPGMLLRHLENKYWRVLAFINKAVHHGVLTVSAGVIKLGDNVIGINEDAAVQFLTNKKNETLVLQIQEQVDRKTGTKSETLETATA